MMERKKALGIRLGLVLALSLLGASAAQGRDWVDFTVAGCKVEATDAPLTNFPVAVRISSARIKGFRYSDIASPDDLLFSSTESKAPYPFEVETWNPDGESVVWVKMPAFGPGRKLYAYYGGPAVAQNAAGVRAIKLDAKEKADRAYLFESGTSLSVEWNGKTISLHRLKTAKRGGQGTKIR